MEQLNLDHYGLEKVVIVVRWRYVGGLFALYFVFV
jgi:hypothetical protein